MTTVGQLPVGQEFRLYRRTRDGFNATQFRYVGRHAKRKLGSLAEYRLAVTKCQQDDSFSYVSVGVYSADGDLLCIVPMSPDVRINIQPAR